MRFGSLSFLMYLFMLVCYTHVFPSSHRALTSTITNEGVVSSYRDHYKKVQNIVILLFKLTDSDSSPLSQASSIGWDDGEVVHMTRTEVVRSEGVVGLSDIGTVSTEDVCCPVLICHILDEDRVPDIMINTSHIQIPGITPGDID